MATDRSFLDYVIEQLNLGEHLAAKRLFGEYALYVDDKVVAFVCDNSVFVKASPAIASQAPNLPWRPPYSGAKDYPVADELLDDAEAIRTLVLATAAALPLPRPRKPARDRRKSPQTG